MTRRRIFLAFLVILFIVIIWNIWISLEFRKTQSIPLGKADPPLVVAPKQDLPTQEPPQTAAFEEKSAITIIKPALKRKINTNVQEEQKAETAYPKNPPPAGVSIIPGKTADSSRGNSSEVNKKHPSAQEAEDMKAKGIIIW